MHFDWTWICFLLIEFFAKHIWQHLVDSDISKEDIIISQKLSLIFELMEVTFQSIKSNHFSNAWNFKTSDLCSEIWFRVLYENANSCVVLWWIEWLGHSNLQWSWCLSHWYLSKCEAQMNITIFFSQQLFLFIRSVFLCEIILECFYCRNHLFWFDSLFNLCVQLFHCWFHCLLVFFL